MFTTDKKEEIQRRLALELEHSNYTQARAAKMLGINPVYFSKIKDKFQWKNIPEAVWNRWGMWEESGDSFATYADDYGTEDNPVVEKRGPKPTNGQAKKNGIPEPIHIPDPPPVNGEMKVKDHLEVIAEKINILKEQGFVVEFSLTLPA